MLRSDLVKEIMKAAGAVGGYMPDAWYLSVDDHGELSAEAGYPEEDLIVLDVPVFPAVCLRGGVWNRHIRRYPLAHGGPL